MANHAFSEFTEQVEAYLRGQDCECLIPDGGLDHWVSQAWDGDSEDQGPEEWAAAWVEQVADSRGINRVHETLCKAQEAAREAADLFLEEFGEPLDPAQTDWDGAAWENDSAGLSEDEQDFFWPIYQETLVNRTKHLAPRRWTADAIHELFSEEYAEADRATREATSGPFNPYGDPFESLVWVGSMEEAREEKGWPEIDPEDYEDGEDDEDFPTIEDAAKEQAQKVVGTGQPLIVAFYDGDFPTVFCEMASEEAVNKAVGDFYDSDECPEPEED